MTAGGGTRDGRCSGLSNPIKKKGESAVSEENRREEDMEQAQELEREAGDGTPEGSGQVQGEPDGEVKDGEDGRSQEEPRKGQEPEEAKDSTKKGFFGKKKEKKDPRDTQIEELTDRLKRNMAEFDNFRKRTEKEKSVMFEIGAKDIIERILPVIDNFERGLNSMPEDAKGTSFAEGMEMIYKQLLKNLEEAGVKPIEAVGGQFDPNFHNAVMHVEDEGQGENVVVQEFQKGYLYRDSVVRHSMVQVAN